jgi:aspartate/methionine/tyrosine aminotransferase
VLDEMLDSLSLDTLIKRREQLLSRLQKFSDLKLNLNMARGLPAPEQLDLANHIMALPGTTQYLTSDGIDCRNYGGTDGLASIKDIFSGILECDKDNIVIGQNSSLSMMHDAVMRAYVWGVSEGEVAWREQGKIRFLCPSPGYDRHFKISELFGFELVPVEMTSSGPNMDQVETFAVDPSVKGIWCVPRYSNPTGVTYSHSTVDRLAQMETATDFRIFWDNAYAEHHLVDQPKPLANILKSCIAHGHPDRVLMFASTSKVTFAGSGISAMGASEPNISEAKSKIQFQTIGSDKLNQLRHAIFFNDLVGLRAHMKNHAAILKPKFDLVDTIFKRELSGKNIATWSKPEGGYFINLDVIEGCARKTIDLTAKTGVTLTPAGSSFPHGFDPLDKNIRIAPTFPKESEIQKAMEIVSICIEIIAIEKQLRTINKN